MKDFSSPIAQKLKELKRCQNQGDPNDPNSKKAGTGLNINLTRDKSIENMIKKINISKSKPKPNFIRKTRNSGVSNTTKVTGQLEIIRKLNQNYANLITSKKPIYVVDEEDSQQQREPKSEICQTKPEYSVKESRSVLSFAYKEDQNFLYKRTMEDKGKSVENFQNDPKQLLLTLFDGHGGDAVSRYLQKYYNEVYSKCLNNSKGNIEQALKNSFKVIDNDIKRLDLVSMGSTGLVVHIIKESPTNCICYIANIGDTRCSLISPTEKEKLSYDHRANDPKEKARIVHSGGSVFHDRVMGQLMLSRAFGDFEFKNFGVKAEPYLFKKVINMEIKNQFLILASDGIWDVVSEDDIRQMITLRNNSEELCSEIMKIALNRAAWDNLSLFVVRLT